MTTVRKAKENAVEGKLPATPAVIRLVPCITASGFKLIAIAKIECIRTDPAGVYVVCPREEFFTKLSLKMLENYTNLIRCHRKFLINLDRVDEIIVRENLLAEIKMRSGRTVPVSRRFLRKLKKELWL